MRGDEISERFGTTRSLLVSAADAGAVVDAARHAVEAARRAAFSAECLLVRALVATDRHEAERRFAALDDLVDGDVLSRFDFLRARQALDPGVDVDELRSAAVDVLASSALESSVGIDANDVVDPFGISRNSISEADVIAEINELVEEQGVSLDEVEDIARERIESFGDAPVFHIIIAMARMAKEDRDGTQQALEEGLARHPRSPRLHGLLGELMYSTDRFDEALGSLRIARLLDPTSRYTLNLLARTQHQRGDFDDETEILLELLDDTPTAKSAELHARLAESLRRNDRFTEALEHIDRSAEITPPTAWVAGTRAQILGALEMWPEAFEAAGRALDLDPDAPQWVLVIRIEAAFEVDELDSAATTATRGVERFPESALMRAYRGTVRSRQGDREGAVSDLEAAYDMTDDRTTIAPFLGRALSEWAEHRRATEGGSPELVAMFERAINLLDDDPDTRLTTRASLAEALRSSGKTEEAIKLATLLVAEHPDYDFVAATLAQAHADANDFATGLEMIDAVLARIPDYFFAHQCRVCCLSGLDRTTEALDAIEKLLEIDGDDPYALVQRSICMSQLGDWDGALDVALAILERGIGEEHFTRYLIGALQNRAHGPGAGRAELKRAIVHLSDAFALSEYGATLMVLGEREQALDLLGEASRSVRESKTASASDWTTVAWCHSAMGDYEGSWRYLRQAESLEPNDPSVFSDQLVLLAITDDQIDPTFARWLDLLDAHNDPARATGTVIELLYLIRLSVDAFDAEASLAGLRARVSDVLESRQRRGGTHVNP